MEINLMCTSAGLQPLYDEDYDEKRKLKIGKIYRAKVVVPRNGAFASDETKNELRKMIDEI